MRTDLGAAGQANQVFDDRVLADSTIMPDLDLSTDTGGITNDRVGQGSSVDTAPGPDGDIVSQNDSCHLRNGEMLPAVLDKPEAAAPQDGPGCQSTPDSSAHPGQNDNGGLEHAVRPELGPTCNVAARSQNAALADSCPRLDDGTRTDSDARPEQGLGRYPGSGMDAHFCNLSRTSRVMS